MRPSGGCWPGSRCCPARLGNGAATAIAIDGKALRVARDKGQSAARTRVTISARAARLRLTLATVAVENGAILEAAIEVTGLIALKGKVVTVDAARTAIAARLRRSPKARR